MKKYLKQEKKRNVGFLLYKTFISLTLILTVIFGFVFKLKKKLRVREELVNLFLLK